MSRLASGVVHGARCSAYRYPVVSPRTTQGWPDVAVFRTEGVREESTVGRRATRPTSSGRQRAPWGRCRAAEIATVLVAALLVILPVGAASAHDALVGSDPADGSVQDVAPSQVVLTFAADQLGLGAVVAVTGPDGAAWSQGDATVAGTTVTQALAPGMPNGAYAVEWRSVSGDGHPTTGTFAFTLEAPAPAPTNEPTTEPVATAPAATATPSEPPAASASPEATPGASDDEPGGFFIWPVVVLLALTAVTVAVRRRARA